ncbi:hypothetical protein [Streptomyces sp. NPDC127039]
MVLTMLIAGAAAVLALCTLARPWLWHGEADHPVRVDLTAGSLDG